MSDATPLPHTLRARLEVVAGGGTLGGFPTPGYVTRGDQALIDRGLVELRGDRLHLTRAGAEVLRGRVA